MITILSPYDFHLLPVPVDPLTKCVAVAIKNDEIIGQLGYREIPSLGGFYVKENYQRQGVGSALLDRMELIVPEYLTFPSTEMSKEFFKKRGLEKKELEIYASVIRSRNS